MEPKLSVVIKKRAALLSIISNTFLIISKLVVGLVSGSVSILSEAVHSFSDLLASFIAFFSVKIASEPADSEHQFGHGKFEDLSGLLEGLLIVGAACFIFYEASSRLINGYEHHLETSLGIVVMLLSIIVNVFVSRHLSKVGQKYDSIALIADAEHLNTDVYTSFGILIALLIIKFTGLTIMDPIIAIAVAALILKTGFSLCFKTAKNLLDESLPEKEKIIIKQTITKYIPNEVLSLKVLKTRRSGADKIIKMTLIVPENLTIKEGHDLCDKIEDDIESNIKNTSVTIHLEPCKKNCYDCNKNKKYII